MSSAGSHAIGQASAQSHTKPYIDTYIGSANQAQLSCLQSIPSASGQSPNTSTWITMRTFPSFDNAFLEPKWGAVSNRACLYKFAERGMLWQVSSNEHAPTFLEFYSKITYAFVTWLPYFALLPRELYGSVSGCWSENCWNDVPRTWWIKSYLCTASPLS